MRVDKLTSFEAETLIRFFLNHLQPELRRRLMTELPVVYRKLLGKDADDAFRRSVKDAVLDKERTYEAPDFLVELAKRAGEDGTGLPVTLGRPGVGKSGALQHMLENLEEDE
jgi:hypothetical protein